MHFLLWLSTLVALWDAVKAVDIPLARRRASLTTSRRSSRSAFKRQSGSGAEDLINSDQDTSYLGIIFLGTPPQPLPVVISTGSSDMWISTNQCGQECGNFTKFSPFTSSSFQSGTEPFSIPYADGQVNGTVGTDDVLIGGLTAQNQRFLSVGSSDSMALQATNTSGSLGFAFDQFSVTHTTPLWRTLLQSGQLQNPLMGIHVTRFSNITNASALEPGGVLTLGNTNSTLFQGDIEYVNLTNPAPTNLNGTFNVPITRFTVGGHNVTLGGNSSVNVGTVFIGATFLAGPPNSVSDFYSHVSGSRPGKGDTEGLIEIPCNTTLEVSITFQSRVWNISSADMVLPFVTPGAPTVCVGALAENTDAINTTWQITEPFMKNVYTVFRWDPPAVGFAELSPAVLSGQIPFDIPGPNPPSTTGSANPSSTATQPAGGSSGSNAVQIRLTFASLFYMLSSWLVFVFLL